METLLTLEEGKYTIVQKDNGCLETLRHGEPWRDHTGDKMFSMLVDMACLNLKMLDALKHCRDLMQELPTLNGFGGLAVFEHVNDLIVEVDPGSIDEAPRSTRNIKLLAKAEDMLDIFKEFISKVERGDARSERTYAAMKNIVTEIEA